MFAKLYVKMSPTCDPSIDPGSQSFKTIYSINVAGTVSFVVLKRRFLKISPYPTFSLNPACDPSIGPGINYQRMCAL